MICSKLLFCHNDVHSTIIGIKHIDIEPYWHIFPYGPAFDSSLPTAIGSKHFPYPSNKKEYVVQTK